ncbi:MAG TPA: hypothetical protein DCZ94_13175 [Lentisphaeria bacterium]|nr:MAG: hypothetical protein A2X48_15305 [Lentisphaerae bacterium GWF2_49_21]HBC87900.1 hypothetical protein [Lentisphaeria bacterium]
MNNNSNFIRTVFSICSGTEVFILLLKSSCRKAIFYLLLLSFLCAALAVLMQSFPARKIIEKYCKALYSQFGEARFTEKGLMPSLEPGKARFMRLEENRVDYMPDKGGAAIFKPDDGISSRGILWLPTSVVLWVKSNSEFYVFPLFFSLSKIPERERIVDKPGDKIIAYAEKNSFEPSKYSGDSPLNFSRMHMSLLVVMLTLVFINIFITILFFIPTSALFFSIVFFLTGKGDMPDEITFASLFTIAVYSSFPGIIIATIYYGLNLPFLDFQTVCLICFLIYLMAVLNKIKRINKPEPEEDAGYDDDDF